MKTLEKQRQLATFNFTFLAVAAALMLAGSPAQAGNLLVNPSFEENSGNNIPVGWTYFAPPTLPSTTHDYWIEGNEAVPHSGSLYWKEWGAGYFPAPTNNVAGIYQEFGSSPGSVYSASGWIYTKPSDTIGVDCSVWIDVSFLDARGNLLALYTSADFSASVGTGTWFQYQVTNACNLSSPVATGDPYFTNYTVSGTATELVAPTGTATVRYRFAYLQVGTEGGSCYFDDAALIQSNGLYAPVIANISPLNMIFVPPTNGLNFNVSSPSGSTISNNAIHLFLNGVDVSGSLAISGSSSNKAVSYQGLQSNTTYTASITATDVFGLSASASNYFETTWVGIPPIIYLWEAEDFDFTNGMYIDYPDLCNAPGDNNCYFGKVGTQAVDEQNFADMGGHLYRAADGICTDISGDLLRQNLVNAGRTDYEINPFDSGEWVNYTRDFTNGTYWMIGRLATDINFSGSLTLSTMNPGGSTTNLGTFTIAKGSGWTSFDNVFLLDTNGNKVNLTLNGKTTLRVTSQGNLLPNFFALVVATVDLPILSGLYPTGTHPFEYTNALSFKIATLGATFPANGITLTLDGINVSSNLVITGSSSNQTVVYPDLLPNAMHTAIITVTNSLGHGIAITNQFDTFSQSNLMVEAEDFDYNDGQYVASWFPEAYYGYYATPGIDYNHSPIAGEQYPYRPDGVAIPQEIGYDFLRDIFIDYGAIDYDLAWYGPGDWANYTRTYPAGTFFVYVRSAGLGPYTMYLDQVVSGVGTSNQITSRLGNWSAVGINNTTHAWVPLTDNGLVAPVAVSLGGVQTLRITTTTGDCYPNYFMLVPATGVKLAAARLGGNVSISLPTQAGVVYRIFYRTNLTSGNWSYLTNLLGNGAVKPVSLPVTGAAQFYKIVAP